MPSKGNFQTNNKTVKPENEEINRSSIISETTQEPCENVQHDINKFGVTYYKISDKSEMYGEDNTQDGCLNPNQIDANFNFLHGDDIKKGEFDANKKILALDRFFCDKDMAKYAKEHPSIGPIKIDTTNLLNGSTFINEKDRRELYISFNGDLIKIPNFDDYCKSLDAKIEKLQEDISKNSTYAVLSFDQSIGFKSEDNNIRITAKLETVSGERPSEPCISIVIKKDGETIAYGENIEQLSTRIIVTGDTIFSTFIKYPLDNENYTEFTTERVFRTYNRIKLGVQSAETLETYTENYPFPRNTVKGEFYEIELPDREHEFYLLFQIPDDLWKLDHNGAYNFRYNGYGIDIQEELFPIIIDDIIYHVFVSGGKYKYDTENEGTFNIEII